MNAKFLLSLTLVAAVSASPGFAADPAAPAQSGGTTGLPQDCAGPAMKKHDHGAERNMPNPAAKAATAPCDPPRAASQAAKAPAKKPLHDHGKVHKNQ